MLRILSVPADFRGRVNRDVLCHLPGEVTCSVSLSSSLRGAERRREAGGRSLPSSGPAFELAGAMVAPLQVVFFKSTGSTWELWGVRQPSSSALPRETTAKPRVTPKFIALLGALSVSFHLLSAHRTPPQRGCGIAEPLPIRSSSMPCPAPGSMAPGAVKPPKPARGSLISATNSSVTNCTELSQGRKDFFLFPPSLPFWTSQRSVCLCQERCVPPGELQPPPHF